MTITLDKPAPAATLQRRTSDWERHEGHGGPKVLPPPGVEWRSASGKTVQRHRYYTRVTTLAKAIDDTSKLMAWKMRAVLVGLGQRPDYVVAAAALTMSDEDRKAADELAKLAADASGPSAALVGTALHTWTERLDRGEPLGHVPEHLRPLIDAYARLTAPLTMHHREVRMICDALEVAGTPDAIGTCSIPDPDGVVDGLRIIDLKSGKVAYPGPMSIQLATYARSDLYDPATGERTPVEGINQRWGLIVHTQQDGKVPPGLYWLNLQHGAEGIELCRLVRSWRKVKPAAVLMPVEGYGPTDVQLPVDDTVVLPEEPEAEPVEQPATPRTLEPLGARRVIAAAVTTRDLDALWQTNGHTWSPELVALATERHAQLREREELERPRAALAAALQTADGATLEQLWAEHGGTPVWTEEHSALAMQRHVALTGRAA